MWSWICNHWTKGVVSTRTPWLQVHIINTSAKERSNKGCKKYYLAVIFILNASKTKFSKYRDNCSNSYQAYNQNLYSKTLEAAHEALEKFKYDTTVYDQQSTSRSSSTRATSLGIYDTYHIFIQNEGPDTTTEESTSTSDEEEEEEPVHA